jgi:cell division protein FtsB
VSDFKLDQAQRDLSAAWKENDVLKAKVAALEEKVLKLEAENEKAWSAVADADYDLSQFIAESAGKP